MTPFLVGVGGGRLLIAHTEIDAQRRVLLHIPQLTSLFILYRHRRAIMGPDRTDFQSVQMFLKEEKSPRTDFGQCYVYSLRIHHRNFCFVKTPEPSGCNFNTYLPTQKEIQTNGGVQTDLL